MVYIIEIKNLRCNKGRAIIKQAVYENFKQLRNYCLSKKKEEACGISSNFGVWILTKYLKKEEMLGRGAYQVTESFHVMDMSDDNINETELKRLVVTLQWMCTKDRLSPGQQPPRPPCEDTLDIARTPMTPNSTF